MNLLNRLPLRQSRAGAWLSTLIVAALLSAGCATQRQVKEIVAESNALLLASELSSYELTANPAGGEKAAPWEEASRKIEVFILAHPDQPVANAALRVRQGVLLLANGQGQLALAAFNEAKAADLKTDRDKALKQLAPDLVWWYQHSTDPTWNDLQRDRAREALAAFDAQIRAVKGSPEVRDFLSEMRAWMGLQLTKELQGQTKVETFVATLNQYSEIFTPEDLTAMKAILGGGNPPVSSTELTVAVRRQLRSKAVLTRARELAKSGSLAALTPQSLKNPTFGELVFANP